MKIKMSSICLFVLILTLSVSSTVFASDKAGQTDLDGVNSLQFKAVIQQIIDLKTNHPEYSEDMLLESMDGEHSQVNRSVIDIWSSLTGSEKRLCIRYPFDAIKVNEAKNIATSQTEIKFGYNGLGDRSDAFRHGIWNAEMTVLIGKEKAELFASAHEDTDVAGNESDGYTKAAHRNMDLHNNEVGRIIGEKNSGVSANEMADIIYREIYLETTQFVWLHE